MIFRRHSLIAIVVIAAVVSIFFSTLIPANGAVARHHARANLSLTGLPLHVHSQSVSSFFSAAPEARAIHAEILLALNCARLC